MRKCSGAFLVPDQGPSYHLNLQHRSRPLHHRHADCAVGSGADGLQHARMPEGCDVAALLQFEPDLIDAARRIDREHELQIDGSLRRCPFGGSKQDEQGPPEGAPDPVALTMGLKAGVHCCRLNMSCAVAARCTTITVM